MLFRVAQVKCYNCGRTCGEVAGTSLGDLKLDSAYVPAYAGDERLSAESPLRCGRCGGAVYVDEPFTLGSGELRPPADVSYTARIWG